MSKADQIVMMIAEHEQAFGGLDILLNNAGIQHVAPIEEFPPEKWDAIIAINLSSAFHSIRAAVPGIKSRTRGPCGRAACRDRWLRYVYPWVGAGTIKKKVKVNKTESNLNDTL